MNHSLELLKLRARLVGGYAVGLAGLRASDVWLATFPKTGSSWLRTTLLHVLRQEGAADANLTTLDAVLPSLGASNLVRPWRYRSLPRLVKTHQPYRPRLFGRPERTLLLVRDPRDAVVSSYHMLSSRALERFEGTLAEFLRHPAHGLPAFFRHYASWQPRATSVIRYEAMKEDAAGEIGRALAAIGAPVPADVLRAAVESASFARMQSREQSAGFANDRWFDADYSFVRKGRAGGWREAFSEDDLAYYHDLRRQTGFDLYA